MNTDTLEQFARAVLAKIETGKGSDREIDYDVFGLVRGWVATHTDTNLLECCRKINSLSEIQAHMEDQDREMHASHFYEGGMSVNADIVPRDTASLKAILRLYGGNTGVPVPEFVSANPRAALAEAIRQRLPGILAAMSEPCQN